MELTMPFRHRIESPPESQHTDLKLRLVEEWKNPQEIEGNPVIIEEPSSGWLPHGASTSPFESMRIYVIWDAWSGVDQLERLGHHLGRVRGRSWGRSRSKCDARSGADSGRSSAAGINY